MGSSRVQHAQRPSVLFDSICTWEEYQLLSTEFCFRVLTRCVDMSLKLKCKLKCKDSSSIFPPTTHARDETRSEQQDELPQNTSQTQVRVRAGWGRIMRDSIASKLFRYQFLWRHQYTDLEVLNQEDHAPTTIQLNFIYPQ